MENKAKWNLVDFTGKQHSRISSPDIWDDMYQKRYMADIFKEELIMEQKLSDVANNIQWYLYMCDDYCYLSAFINGIAYRNGGVGWSCVGGAEIEKKIAGHRLVRVS